MHKKERFRTKLFNNNFIKMYDECKRKIKDFNDKRKNKE